MLRLREKNGNIEFLKLRGLFWASNFIGFWSFLRQNFTMWDSWLVKAVFCLFVKGQVTWSVFVFAFQLVSFWAFIRRMSFFLSFKLTLYFFKLVEHLYHPPAQFFLVLVTSVTALFSYSVLLSIGHTCIMICIIVFNQYYLIILQRRPSQASSRLNSQHVRNFLNDIDNNAEVVVRNNSVIIGNVSGINNIVDAKVTKGQVGHRDDGLGDSFDAGGRNENEGGSVVSEGFSVESVSLLSRVRRRNDERQKEKRRCASRYSTHQKRIFRREESSSQVFSSTTVLVPIKVKNVKFWKSGDLMEPWATPLRP